MLIDRGVSPGEIITVKTTSGEEIIAKLIEEDTTHYTLLKPMIVIMTKNGVDLFPYLLTINLEKNIKLAKSVTTMLIEPTEKTFANRYIELTTNIKLV